MEIWTNQQVVENAKLVERSGAERFDTDFQQSKGNGSLAPSGAEAANWQHRAEDSSLGPDHRLVDDLGGVGYQALRSAALAARLAASGVYCSWQSPLRTRREPPGGSSRAPSWARTVRKGLPHSVASEPTTRALPSKLLPFRQNLACASSINAVSPLGSGLSRRGKNASPSPLHHLIGHLGHTLFDHLLAQANRAGGSSAMRKARGACSNP